MPLDIVAEIASRLDVDKTELEPVVETVVQRIRQQVTHYGYARVAGLGTFRGRDGHIVFEPDAVLAETVNQRFAGLAPIRVKAPEVVGAPAARWDEKELPEEQTLSEFEEEDAAAEEDESAAEEAEAAVAPEEPEATPEPEATSEPEVTFEPEPTTDPQAFPKDETDDWTSAEDDAADVALPSAGQEDDQKDEMWREQGEEDDHPLGPVPAPAYEDAEFSLVGEQDDEAGPLPELDFDDEDAEEAPQSEEEHAGVESASMWAALGAATVEEQDEVSEEIEESAATHPEEREPIVDDEPIDEEETVEAEDDDLVTSETKTPEAAPTGRKHGPDRDALHHDHAQREWPSEHDPSTIDRQASRRNTIMIGVGVIVLVAAAAIAYFSLQPLDPTGTEPTAQTETQQPADTEPPAGATEDEAQAEADETPTEPTPVDPEPAPAEPADESTPLRSQESVDAEAGGYTIVVYSETNQGSATDVAQEYRDEGFRSGVLSSQEGGVTRYRVAIGQFETLEAAADARDRLAGSDLPQDAWVHRID